MWMESKAALKAAPEGAGRALRERRRSMRGHRWTIVGLEGCIEEA